MSKVVNTLKGHKSAVYSVCFSPDGELLASGSWDKSVKLWNVKTGNCLNTLKGHEDYVTSVCFSPDGELLASGSVDYSVKLWNVKTGNCLNTLKGHEGLVFSVCFSPDGELLASGSRDNSVKLWNVKTGRCVESMKWFDSITSVECVNDLVVHLRGGSRIQLSFMESSLSVISAYSPIGDLRNMLHWLSCGIESRDEGGLVLIRRECIRESFRLSSNKEVNVSNCLLNDEEVEVVFGCVSRYECSSVDLSKNNIHNISESIGLLKSLRILNLSENPLEYISPSFGLLCDSLEKLVLDVSHGSWFERKFGDKNEVEITGKKLKKILLGGGLRSIPLPCMKVHFVGRFGSGKTTLVRGLLGELKEEDKYKRESTSGVETSSRVELSNREEKKVTVRFLDFAGHYEYYAGHELFLYVDVGIFVVVIDMTLVEWRKHLKYWIYRLEELSPNYGKSGVRRLIIVGSHWDMKGRMGSEEFRKEVEKICGENVKTMKIERSNVICADLYENEDVREVENRIVEESLLFRGGGYLPLVTNVFGYEVEGLYDYRRELEKEYPSQKNEKLILPPVRVRDMIEEIGKRSKKSLEKFQLRGINMKTSTKSLVKLLESCDEIIMYVKEEEEMAIIEPSSFRLLVFRHFFRDPNVEMRRNDGVAFGEKYGAIVSNSMIEKAKNEFVELKRFPIIEFMVDLGLCIELKEGRREERGYVFPSLLSGEYEERLPIDRFVHMTGRRYECGFDTSETLFLRVQVLLLGESNYFTIEKGEDMVKRMSDSGMWLWSNGRLVIEILHKPDRFRGICMIVYMEREEDIELGRTAFIEFENVLVKALLKGEERKKEDRQEKEVEDNINVEILDLNRLNLKARTVGEEQKRIVSVLSVKGYSFHEIECRRIEGKCVGDGNRVEDMLRGQS